MRETLSFRTKHAGSELVVLTVLLIDSPAEAHGTVSLHRTKRGEEGGLDIFNMVVFFLS